jgi:hypothetical protein
MADAVAQVTPSVGKYCTKHDGKKKPYIGHVCDEKTINKQRSAR